jgi:peptide deformylase
MNEGERAPWRLAMAVKEVLRMGDARLLQVAELVEQFDAPELHALIQDMHDTMGALNGAGLAAPQIGVGLQVVIFGVGRNPRYPDAESVPYTVLLNPTLTKVDDEVEEGWEGCLSVPGMRGVVPRYERVRYEGFDQYGNPIDRTVSGFHARVVQHECDHLYGILYPMRMKDMRLFGFTDVLFPNQHPIDE